MACVLAVLGLALLGTPAPAAEEPSGAARVWRAIKRVPGQIGAATKKAARGIGDGFDRSEEAQPAEQETVAKPAPKPVGRPSPRAAPRRPPAPAPVPLAQEPLAPLPLPPPRPERPPAALAADRKSVV